MFKKYHIAFTLLLLASLFLLHPSVFGLNPATPKDGDPNGIYRGIFKFSESGSPTTAENSANYHACTNPVYSQANWVEIDGTLGGTSGTPTTGPNGRGNPPNYLFTRANCHYVELLDSSGSCSVRSHPWDHNNTAEYFVVGAYVYPNTVLTCADLGNQYDVLGKWDAGSGDCSYRVWLEALDSNGGGCVDSDMGYYVRAAFNDSGTTFDCSSYCEVKQPATGILTSAWSRIDVVFNPVATPSMALILINNKQTTTNVAAQTCQDGTDIPDGFGIADSGQNLYIGTEKGAINCFQGMMSGVTIIQSPHLNFQRNSVLNHLDASTYSSSYTNYSGGEDPLLTYAIRFHAASTPTPGNLIAQTDSTNKRHGDSISFDGVDDFAIITPAASFNDPGRTPMDALVVEAWIRPTTAVGGRRQAIATRWSYNDDATCTANTALSTYNLFIDATGKVNFAMMTTTGTTVTVSGNTVLTDNQWYHVAGIYTGNTSQYLTAERLYVMIDGKSDVTTPATFTGSPNITALSGSLLGATNIEAPATTCLGGVGAYRDFFEGNIDEFVITVPTSALGIEAMNNGVVINEVNFKSDINSYTAEAIELYAFSDLGRSINMDGYTLGLCSRSNIYVFDDACANCASKVVDPGDLVTIYLTPFVTPMGGNVDTSCSGAATTCTWWAENTSAGLQLDAGDMVEAGDGVILYNQSEPDTNAKKYASAIDAVIWGADQGACQDNLSDNVRGIWEATDFLQVGLISDETRSLCLDIDGGNEFASSSWAQCAETIGALNTTRTTAIQLLSFSAETAGDNGVDIRWETGIEENVFGFNILRADYEFGDYTQINGMLIEAKGGSGIGATYTFYDIAGQRTSYYKLQEIEYDGMSALYGPITTKENIAATKSLEEAANSASPNGFVDSDNGFETGASTGGGCGRIAASDSLAGVSLLALMLVAMFLSTRTYLLAEVNIKK